MSDSSPTDVVEMVLDQCVECGDVTAQPAMPNETQAHAPLYCFECLSNKRRQVAPSPPPPVIPLSESRPRGAT